jgi:transposase
MADYSEVFVGIDTSKLRNAVAIAQGGRNGEVRYLGEIENTEAATRKLVKKLAAQHPQLTFCYEAGPTGYGLYRLIKALGHECMVVAPSLIPKKPGDRVKTNRRDALNLAKLLRAGELTAVWVPDARHEAMRDLVRARETAVDDLKSKRQQVLSLLLRLGRHFTGKRTWTRAHMNWLVSQKLAHREQRIAFEEMLLAVRQADERVSRLERPIDLALKTLDEGHQSDMRGNQGMAGPGYRFAHPGYTQSLLHRHIGRYVRTSLGTLTPSLIWPTDLMMSSPSSCAKQA